MTNSKCQEGLDHRKENKLDVGPKVLYQTGFVGQLTNDDGVNADEAQSMLVLTILEKIREMKLRSSQGSVTVL